MSWLAIIVRNCYPSFVGQLNEFSVLTYDETLAILETIYNCAWLNTNDVSLQCLDAFAFWNPRVQSVVTFPVQVLLNRLHRRALKYRRSES